VNGSGHDLKNLMTERGHGKITSRWILGKYVVMRKMLEHAQDHVDYYSCAERCGHTTGVGGGDDDDDDDDTEPQTHGFSVSHAQVPCNVV
jgi:hypothetical protein